MQNLFKFLKKFSYENEKESIKQLKRLFKDMALCMMQTNFI